MQKEICKFEINQLTDQVMQIPPPKELLPYIKHYLFLESNAAQQKTLRLFSDGNTGMVFLLRQGRLSVNNSHYLPSSFLYGQISHFQDLVLAKKTSFIITVFQPDGLYQLLRISARELKDQIVNTRDIFGQSATRLHEALVQCKQPTDKIQILNAFFYDLMSQRKFSGHPLISSVLRHINQHKGLLSVEQLVRYTGYTERHMERIFAEQIGMSPKKFTNIVQLHTFLKLLRSKSDITSLTTICHESGYFDQSHLIRAFKKYTGITPSEYLNGTSRLAVNFMEFNDMHDPMSGLYNLS
ncbi:MULTISPECIES: AraC family transcriptional regulator [Sphingobacterium]|uniref:AraC family transcriptional regulator n=1 Tax=Sphingobacterium TaxID=28453 RepID=UPI00257C74AA|nr:MULTISPECIES: helix-turn-helix domain-containing protein [Sphingobacterium]